MDSVQIYQSSSLASDTSGRTSDKESVSIMFAPGDPPAPPPPPLGVDEESMEMPTLMPREVPKDASVTSAPVHRESVGASKVDAALEELIRTESEYVLALRTLVDEYMPRLSEHLSAAERRTIFSTAESIAGMHVELDSRLCAARAEPSLRGKIRAVARAFETLLPFLKLYASYCAGYCSALDTLERARAERPALGAAISRAEAQLANHRQGEGDLRLAPCLIRPVKRLCLYPLLLSALCKELEAAEAAHALDRTAERARRSARPEPSAAEPSAAESSVESSGVRAERSSELAAGLCAERRRPLPLLAHTHRSVLASLHGARCVVHA